MNILLIRQFWPAICRYMLLNLFLTLVSLPILIWWGLPISVLGPVGNLFFAPFLSFFLFLSSIIFFCELASIPHEPFDWLLDHLTYVWQSFLKINQNGSLIGFAKPSIWFLVIIPLCAFAIISHRATRHPHRALIALTCLLLCTGMYLRYRVQTYQPVMLIPKTKPQITYVSHLGKRILIDPGTLGARSSAASWVRYTLVPEIIKTHGSLILDHVIILQRNHFTFDGLCALCRAMDIKKISLPAWDEKLPYPQWRAYCQLRDMLAEKNIRIKFIKETKITTGVLPITITPNTQTENTPMLLTASFQIDRNQFALYASKLKKGTAPRITSTTDI